MGISNIPELHLLNLETKQRNKSENYTAIKVPLKYKQTVQELPKNENIIIIIQDKRRELVIMDKPKYVEKSLLLLDSKNFKKLDYDPIKKTEEKIQRIL